MTHAAPIEVESLVVDLERLLNLRLVIARYGEMVKAALREFLRAPAPAGRRTRKGR